jgi:hypothetical protein
LLTLLLLVPCLAPMAVCRRIDLTKMALAAGPHST